MASENMPTRDLELQVWATNFATVALANATDLGLTTGQTTLLTSFATLFSTKMTAMNTAKIAAKTAITAKNDARALLVETMGAYAKSILANPDIANDLKNELGMSTSATPPAAVSTPIDLVAKPYPNGTNGLAWKRGANSKSVTYVLEAKVGLSPTWSMIGQTQGLKFDDNGRVPGEMVSYRVTAERGGAKSLPSIPTTVYVASEPESVFLKEAA